LAAFQEREAANVAAIVQAIYGRYQAVYFVARREYRDKYAEENVPPPTGSRSCTTGCSCTR